MKMDKKDNIELTIIFSQLTKNFLSIEKIIEKYKYPELHSGLAKMYKGMGEFSEKMLQITLDTDYGHD